MASLLLLLGDGRVRNVRSHISPASLLLTTEAIAEKPEKKKGGAMPDMGRMGGMGDMM